jgi:hypothetical protein
MPDSNVPADEASKLSVTDDVDGVTSPDEANVNVSFELAAPVYGVENAAVTAVTVLSMTSGATVPGSEVPVEPHVANEYDPAAGSESTETVIESAAAAVKVRISFVSSHDASLAAPLTDGLEPSDYANPGMYNFVRPADKAAANVTVNSVALPGVRTDDVGVTVKSCASGALNGIGHSVLAAFDEAVVTLAKNSSVFATASASVYCRDKTEFAGMSAPAVTNEMFTVSVLVKETRQSTVLAVPSASAKVVNPQPLVSSMPGLGCQQPMRPRKSKTCLNHRY